jgi:dolichyl-phosphate beta-glucosyltransferase
MPSVDLSIIIPAYMEAKMIADSLDRLAAFLKTRDYGVVEVLVVVADSTDGTATIVLSRSKLFTRFRVIQPGPRVGKGRDVRIGIFEAEGRYRIFMDADLATPLEHLDAIKSFMDDHGQVAIGIRDLVSTHRGLLRKTITRSGNLLAQLLLLPGIDDTQCGFKAFEASVAQDVFGRMTITGWGFDMEILAIARRRHYKITKLAIPDWYDPKLGDEGLAGDSASSAAIQVLRDLIKIRFMAWAGRYRTLNYVHRPVR